MKIKTFLVDAFTDKPYTGNPAGVCILDQPISDVLMQRIAREINYSETAFLVKMDKVYSLRWFTPRMEINLCGHATLASAYVLYLYGLHKISEPILFETKSGILSANKVNELIELNFPQFHVTECPSSLIIEKAFDIKPIYIGRNDNRYLIEIENIVQLKRIQPDFQLLKESDLGRFIITAQSYDRFNFYSRFFAPSVGVNEDPATGSSHCYLAPYWASKLNMTKLLAFQVSERTGIFECEIAENNRVLLRGNAILMNEMKMDWMSINI